MTTSSPSGTLTDDPRLVNFADSAWRLMLGVGIGAVVLGIIVLAWPGPTLRVVGVLFAIYLIVTGIIELVSGFASHLPGWSRAISILAGVVSILLGLLCLRGPLTSILLLSIWIGITWLFRGLYRLTLGASSPELPGRGGVIFDGAMLTIGGAIILVAPLTSIAALTLLAGISLIVIGVSHASSALQLRRSLN